MRCCESTSEERRAGNLHAAFCGSRRWVTASGDPVGAIERSLLYPATPWRAIGGLNSGRLVATDISRLRDMLSHASNFPLHTSYPMYSWVITNIMMKYAGEGEASKYIREVFDGVVRGVEFYFLVAGGDATLSERGQWKESAGESTHVLIRHGEKDRAYRYIMEWVRRSADEYLVVVDPYFGPEELNFLVRCDRNKA